jgi:hypothetical protein
MSSDREVIIKLGFFAAGIIANNAGQPKAITNNLAARHSGRTELSHCRTKTLIAANASLPQLITGEIPRLCRGGSRTLTVPGCHAHTVETSTREPPKHTKGNFRNFTDGEGGENKGRQWPYKWSRRVPSLMQGRRLVPPRPLWAARRKFPSPGSVRGYDSSRQLTVVRALGSIAGTQWPMPTRIPSNVQ